MADKHFMHQQTEEIIKKKKESNETEAPQYNNSPTNEAIQRAISNPTTANLTPSVMTAMQSTYGNQFVTQLARQQNANSSKLTAPIQMKMSVTPANDLYENEADDVAKNVVNQINSANDVQREGEEEEVMAKRIQREEMPEEEMMTKRIQREGMEEEEMQMKRIQRQEVPEEEEMQMKRIQREGLEEEEMQMKRIQRKGGEDGFDVNDDIEGRIENSRGGGQSLDGNTRQSMENAFGADFSGVRIHTGSEASDLSNSVQARAFTTGSDIFFNEGEYNPGSSDGQELLAHELTHTVQQGAAKVQPKREEQ